MKSQKATKQPIKQVQQQGMMITGTMMNVGPQKQPTVPLQLKQQTKPIKQVAPTQKKTAPPQQKQQQKPKVEVKKETQKIQVLQLPIIEEKKEQENNYEKDDDGPQFSISQGPIIQQEQAQVTYKKDPVIGEVTVKYSHYKEKFQITDGILYEKLVDEQYCLSFAFKGDYKLLLRKEGDPPQKFLDKLPQGGAWKGCEQNQTYLLYIDEDPVQVDLENKNKKVYQAPKEEYNQQLKNNKKVDLLTQELKGLSIEQLKEKDAKYKELIEARDLEDILFK